MLGHSTAPCNRGRSLRRAVCITSGPCTHAAQEGIFPWEAKKAACFSAWGFPHVLHSPSGESSWLQSMGLPSHAM